MTSDPGDLVLDPTCGRRRGVGGCSPSKWGRRWITIDTSRSGGRPHANATRRAAVPYHLAGGLGRGPAEKRQELTERPSRGGPFRSDVRQGFVYRRLPHVKLSDIAQNPDIKPGMSRAEIDAAIDRNSEHELLFDQPYEDRRIVRVWRPLHGGEPLTAPDAQRR